MIEIQYNQADLDKLCNACNVAVQVLHRNAHKVALQGMRLALRAAARATPIHKGKKFRKVVSWTGENMAFLVADTKGRMFPLAGTLKDVSSDGRIARVKWAREAWKKGVRTLIPLAAMKHPKADQGRGAKIPHIGYAKNAWRKLIPLFGFQEVTPGGTSPIRATMDVQQGFASLTAENLSSYLDKIAPDAAAIGLQHAANSMNAMVNKEINKRIQKGWM